MYIYIYICKFFPGNTTFIQSFTNFQHKKLNFKSLGIAKQRLDGYRYVIVYPVCIKVCNFVGTNTYL